MGDKVNFARRRLVNLLEHLLCPLSHDHQPGRARDQLLHHASLLEIRLAQDGMERRDHGRFQFAQQHPQVTSCRPAENPELVLHADQVHVAVVDEVRCAPVGREVLLFYFETDDTGILVAFLHIIYRYSETLGLRVPRRHSGKQVGREGSDAALARQVVADERDLFNLRHRFHKFTWHVPCEIDTPLSFWHGP